MATLRPVDPETDRRVVELGDAATGVWVVADELAVCLRRFVDVTADDRTLDRAAQALAAWDRLSQALNATEPRDRASVPA